MLLKTLCSLRYNNKSGNLSFEEEIYRDDFDFDFDLKILLRKYYFVGRRILFCSENIIFLRISFCDEIFQPRDFVESSTFTLIL